MKFTVSNDPNEIEKVQPQDIPFKVKLGDIETRKFITKNNPLKFFKVRMIRKSLKDKGYDPGTFGHIALTYDSNIDKYVTFDGNHRIAVLKETYGDDYEIEAKRHLPCDDCGDVTWDIPIAHTPTMLFFVMYTLLPTIIVLAVFYITYYYLPDFKIYAKLHNQHPVNGLRWLYNKSEAIYTFIMRVFYNINYILNVILALIYVIWILYYNFYICMIVVVIQIILTQTLKYFNMEELKYGDVIKKLKFW